VSAAVLSALAAVVLSAHATAADRAAAPRVERVIIAFKTHFDIGYTDMAVNVVQRYRTEMIDKALAVVDRTADLPPERRFVWTTPGWPMKKILEDWEGQTTERRQRVWQAYRDGRFVTHALPFTTHTELLEVEDLVRGLTFTSQLSRTAGLPLPRDAKMTDVPCHSWIMPTLLRHAGVDFLHLGCNAASSSPEVPMLFWWEGPDGSRVLTMYAAQGYGTGLVPPADWPYKTWLALIHTGDNAGPPPPDQVQTLLREAEQKLPGVQVRIGRLSDFSDAILAEQAAVPVVRGDMPDTWIHGPMCDPAGAQIARNVRPAIAGCEALQTQLRAWGVTASDTTAAIAGAYESSLLYGEHTWGGALYWVTSYAKQRNYSYGDAWKQDRAAGRFAKLDASWEEHTNYIRTARDLIVPAVASQTGSLAQAVSVAGPRIVVYNPLPWPRDGIVRVAVDKPAFAALRATDGEETIAIERDGAAVRFAARAVPAMGYRTYVPAPAAADGTSLRADEREAVLESPFCKAAIDIARGTLCSLVDKRTGRELVDGAASPGAGQYLYERFDADQVKSFVAAYVKLNVDWAINELGKPSLPPAGQVPYRAASPEKFTAAFTRTPVSVSATLNAAAGSGCPHPVTTRFTLYRDLPCADIELVLHNKPADPWPEAGWLCLPLKVASPQFRLGRQASIVDPARDIVRGTNRHLLAVTGGLTVTDPVGGGVGLCSLDNPLLSLDTPGCWKYSRDFVPRQSRVYVNLFNNQWTTNFRLWNEGTWTARVRLWAVAAYDAQSSLVMPAAEARSPLLAGFADGAAGSLPTTRCGLELSAPAPLVTAFGRNPDGDGIVLRLWEHAGRTGSCEVRLPPGLATRAAQPVDLRGQPRGTAVRVDAGRFTVPLRPFAPASYVLR
jgi:hypothetical protein